MKNPLKLLILPFLLISITSFSQDIITKKDGSEIQAKILEVTPSEIKYKRFDNQTGPIFTILISDLILIKYENGSNEAFNQNTVPKTTSTSSEPEPDNLKAPNSELMKNPNYNAGYIDQAHKTKKKKVWKSFGIASGVWLALIIALNASGVSY